MISIIEIAKHGFSAYRARCEQLDVSPGLPWTMTDVHTQSTWISLAQQARADDDIALPEADLAGVDARAAATVAGQRAMRNLIASVH